MSERGFPWLQTQSHGLESECSVGTSGQETLVGSTGKLDREWKAVSTRCVCKQSARVGKRRFIPLGNSGSQNRTHTAEFCPSMDEGVGRLYTNSQYSLVEAWHFQFALLEVHPDRS